MDKLIPLRWQDNTSFDKDRFFKILSITRFFPSKYSVSYDDIWKRSKLQITNGEHTKTEVLDF